jgi:hypothetical protein
MIRIKDLKKDEVVVRNGCIESIQPVYGSLGCERNWGKGERVTYEVFTLQSLAPFKVNKKITRTTKKIDDVYEIDEYVYCRIGKRLWRCLPSANGDSYWF